jgi:hypothetical protein
LIYLVNQESEERVERERARADNDLQNAVFAADLHNGLKIFKALFGSESDVVPDEVIEGDDFEWEHPQSEEEAIEIMQKFEQMMTS